MSAHPSSSIMMFAGLMSRCTTPWRCACARPRPTCPRMACAMVGGEASTMPQNRVERAPLHVPHDEVRQVVGFVHRVDRDDVGMIERGDRAGLAPEPLARLRIGDVLWRHDLDGHAALQRKIAREIYDAHTTLPQLPQQLVLPRQCVDQVPEHRRLGSHLDAILCRKRLRPLLIGHRRHSTGRSGRGHGTLVSSRHGHTRIARWRRRHEDTVESGPDLSPRPANLPDELGLISPVALVGGQLECPDARPAFIEEAHGVAPRRERVAIGVLGLERDLGCRGPPRPSPFRP